MDVTVPLWMELNGKESYGYKTLKVASRVYSNHQILTSNISMVKTFDKNIFLS